MPAVPAPSIPALSARTGAAFPDALHVATNRPGNRFRRVGYALGRVRPGTGSATAMALLLGIGCVAPPCSATEMYRYVDENGVTVYSQSPPPGGEAVRIRADVVPGAGGGGEPTRPLGTAGAPGGADPSTPAAKLRSSGCEAAEGNLRTLEDPANRRLQMPDGTIMEPTDEERAAMAAAARAQIKALCE